ncbi:MAG: hypothetical protein H7Z74_08195 [Anaerolineae bacterium]|nr:hypothetical protein [Gemmatimonadaceae bacterium]
MNRFAVIVSLAAAAAFANPAEAQRRDRGENIPAEYRPPAGQCRIWIDGIAPGLQPKPTSCEAAERAARENTHIIYGSQVQFPSSQTSGSSQAGGWTKVDRDQWCRENSRRNHPDCRNRDRDWDDDDDDDRDRDRNGQWDRSRYPERLPEMRSAIFYQRGQRVEEVRRWVGERNLRVEMIDSDDNGRPERVTWLNRGGKVIQVWVDRNRDGRADRIEFYKNGKRFRVLD